MYKPFEKKHILIAHRGYSLLYPENTLLAFKKSIFKFDMFEFDVQFTKDLVPVVYHDESIKSKLIKECNFNEIKDTKIKKFKNAQKIPTLKEVVELIKKHKIYANLEIKPSLEKEKVIKIIEEEIKEVKDYIIVSSFNHEYLEIDAFRAALFDKTLPNEINGYIKNMKLDAVHISKELAKKIDPKLISKPLNVYTINDKKEVESLFKRGFKGVFSDGL
ncbi:glycerophosphodiester phosphodiesterase [Caminibacter sp.]